jgi:hypothetical protein
MDWTKTTEDDLPIYTSGDYEIVKNYEEGWQLNLHGRVLNTAEAIPSLRKAKEYAEEHSRFN